MGVSGMMTNRIDEGMMRSQIYISTFDFRLRGEIMERQTLLSMAMVLFCFCATRTSAQDDSKTIKSFYSKSDFALTADPNSEEWKKIKGAIATNGPRGDLTPGHRTEIRSRWTERNLYMLFICPYEELYSKPDPSSATETNKLWEWDVAEVFIGADFQNIKRYAEFQV